VAAEGAKFEEVKAGDLKNSCHEASTELGSLMYFSYISSTSQSLVPKFPLTGDKPIGRRQVEKFNGKCSSTFGILVNGLTR
jgi:hypothetical protein